MVWFTLFFLWIWLAIAVFADIFRSHDLGGWAKALWTIFVIAAPFLGILVYLIARGHKMGEHAVAAAEAQDAAARAYIQETVQSDASGGPASELGKLIDLRDQGVINDAEFEQMKAKVVTGV
jgi:hypothetical protein